MSNDLFESFTRSVSRIALLCGRKEISEFHNQLIIKIIKENKTYNYRASINDRIYICR